MARSDLTPIFEIVGLPVTQGGFSKDEVIPDEFIEYHIDGSDDKAADNAIYKRIDRWVVSVYGRTGNMTSFYEHCEELEGAFAALGIFARRSMDLFPDGDLALAQYTFTLDH